MFFLNILFSAVAGLLFEDSLVDDGFDFLLLLLVLVVLVVFTLVLGVLFKCLLVLSGWLGLQDFSSNLADDALELAARLVAFSSSSLLGSKPC